MHTWTSQKKIVNGLPLPCFLTVSYPRKSYHCNPSTSTLKDSDPELLPEKGCTSMTFAKGVFMTILTCPPFPATLPLFKFPEYWLTAPQITTRPPARMRSNMTSLVEGTRKLSEPHLRQKHWTNIERTWLKESRSYHKFDI